MLTTPLRMPKLPRFLERLLQDPPPAWVVEFSEQSVVAASTGDVPQLRKQTLAAGALVASPVDPNLKHYDAVESAVAALQLRSAEQASTVQASNVQANTTAALILPDYSVRVSVLDFEEFPASRDEQEPLVRFRLRKIVPYDLDAARLSFAAFPRAGSSGVSVVASMCPLHVLAEYESLLRGAGCHAGFVTSSALAALELLPAEKVAVLAKLSGRVATVAVCQEGVPRLFRTVELTELNLDEVLALLQPTFALVEDNLGATVEGLWLAGFDDAALSAARSLQQDLGVPVETLRSPFGALHSANTGAYGYLQSIKEARA